MPGTRRPLDLTRIARQFIRVAVTLKPCRTSYHLHLSDSQQMKLCRGFLDLTQAQLAAELDTTQTSVGRWELGITPISMMTMGHLRALVTSQIMEETRGLFTKLIPKLTLSEYDGLFGNLMQLSVKIQRDVCISVPSS
jgi:transcriptional regulator with XRE-family HTH domain